jgi:hypothetical protein
MATTPWLRDANFYATKAFPAAAATNYSDSFDLGAVSGGIDSRLFAVELVIPALAAHTDTTKTILITLQDSADNSSFAAVAPLHQAQIVGVATTGSAAVTYIIRVPPSIRRYIRFDQTNPSGGPAVTASSVAYSLLFH